MASANRRWRFLAAVASVRSDRNEAPARRLLPNAFFCIGGFTLYRSASYLGKPTQLPDKAHTTTGINSIARVTSCCRRLLRAFTLPRNIRWDCKPN